MSVEQHNCTLYSFARHLAVAGQLDRVRQLLITFNYLQANVDALGLPLLLNNYDLAITPGRRWLMTLPGDSRQLKAVSSFSCPAHRKCRSISGFRQCIGQFGAHVLFKFGDQVEVVFGQQVGEPLGEVPFLGK